MADSRDSIWLPRSLLRSDACQPTTGLGSVELWFHRTLATRHARPQAMIRRISQALMAAAAMAGPFLAFSGSETALGEPQLPGAVFVNQSGRRSVVLKGRRRCRKGEEVLR